MLFLLYRIGKFLTIHLPLKAGYALATMASSVYCLFSVKDKDAVRTNLKILFPHYSDEQINDMTKKVFINFGKYLVDFFRFSKIDKAYIDRYVKVEGIENLKDALKDGRGAIVVTAHLGNWELGGVVVSALGFPLALVALDHRNAKVNRFFVRQRQMKGIEVIPTGAAIRRCFLALVGNQVLALAGDRDYFDNGIKVEFFGKDTIVPKGPSVFNRRCGSPIVPGFMIRNSGDTFTLKFYEPIRTQTTKDERSDLIALTRRIVTRFEDEIRQHPTQWYVFRPFWEKIGWGKNSK